MLNLLPKKLKAIAIIRDIKGYKSMSEDRVLSVLKASESLKESQKSFDDTKPKINFSKSRIEEIRKKFNELTYKFSKLNISKIRRNFHEIVNEKNLSAPKIKEIEQNLLELEKNLSKPKKYCDNIKYKGIRSVRNLFDLSIDEYYYKPITINDNFNNNYIQYESKGNKDKILTINEYLDMIRPYLSDKINKHKPQGEWKLHSGNIITNYKTQGEWKIQLTTAINIISSREEILMRFVLCIQKVIIYKL